MCDTRQHRRHGLPLILLHTWIVVTRLLQRGRVMLTLVSGNILQTDHQFYSLASDGCNCISHEGLVFSRVIPHRSTRCQEAMRHRDRHKDHRA